MRAYVIFDATDIVYVRELYAMWLMDSDEYSEVEVPIGGTLHQMLTQLHVNGLAEMRWHHGHVYFRITDFGVTQINIMYDEWINNR